MRIGRLLALVGTLAIAMSACGSGTADATAQPPSTTISEAMAMVAEVDERLFSSEELILIEAEATWMCDAQRFASADAGAAADARSDRLASFGVDEESYAAFLEQLDARVELRDAVFAEFVDICIER